MLIEKNKDLTFEILNKKCFVLDGEKGKYYEINEVGTRLWQSIKDTSTLDELVEIIVNDYGIPNDKALVHVLDFINDGIKNGLLKNKV